MANPDHTHEPLLTETQNKYVMFPITYPDVYEMYKKAISAFWVPDEINFAQDLVDLDKLSDNEKFFINHVLAFFAASDGIVMDNLSTRFSCEIPHAEVRAFYASQNMMESIHSETYSLLIDTYVKDEAEKDKLFNAVTNFSAIKEKADWAIKWIESKEAPFSQRLIAFAIVEGIYFSASFCAIFWMRDRGLLPGLSFANQLIARDESLHADFACILYGKIHNRLSQQVVHDMFREAVEIEKKFIIESIPCSMIGMNDDLMTDYIMYIADRLLLQLGYAKIYNKQNPFQFMERSAHDSKVSFFERRNPDYAKSCISFVAGKSGVPNELTFDATDDF
jgi:ribonucleotide reductase beta subunit family protein with ferritin-like domain